MSQAVLCIGLGDFGEQCLHQIQDWISPSSKIDTSTYRKFLEHNSEYWGFISRSPEFEEDPFLIDDLMQPTVAGQQPQSMIQFKEAIYHSLVHLLQKNHVDTFQIYILASGETLADIQGSTAQKSLNSKQISKAYLRIQYAIEEQIKKIGSFSQLRGETATPIEERNVHIHFILNAPKLSLLSGLSKQDQNLTQSFVQNLTMIDKVAQKVGPGALSKIWVTSRFLPGTILQRTEIVACCAALVRLLSKTGLRSDFAQVNGDAFTSFKSNIEDAAKKESTRQDWQRSTINLFSIGSASLPIGAIYKYSLYRNLYDAFGELKDRVTKDASLESHQRSELWHTLEPEFKNFVPLERHANDGFSSLKKEGNVAGKLMSLAGKVSSRFAGRLIGEGGLYESVPHLTVSFGESPADVQKRYPNLYTPITSVVENSDIETVATEINSVQDNLDKEEAIVIDRIRSEIEHFIEDKCGKIQGLQNFRMAREILQETQQKCYLDIFEWEKNISKQDPMEGMSSLVEATNKLPSKKDIFFTTFGISLLLMTFGSLFTSPMNTSSTQLIGVPTLADLWSSNVWLSLVSLLSCLIGGYLITQVLFRNLYRTLAERLTERRNIIQTFIQTGGSGPVAEKAFVSLEIRKERINRATLNHIIDLLGKMDAISLEIGRRMQAINSVLVNMKVQVGVDASADDISDLVYDNYRLHTSLCAPNELSAWASTCRIQDKFAWVSNLIAKSWPTSQIFSDIPVGDDNSLYEMSYYNVEQVKTNSPLTQERRTTAIKRCRTLLRNCSNSFKLFCEPINHLGQPTPNKFDPGERYLALSFGLRSEEQRLIADLGHVSHIIVDEHQQQTERGQEIVDEYMMYLNVWSNVHPEDMLRGIAK